MKHKDRKEQQKSLGLSFPGFSLRPLRSFAPLREIAFDFAFAVRP
jgi:hypothetical protein